MKLLSTADVKPAKNILLYGPTKVGKTYSIQTMPNPVILATDDGVSSLNKVVLPYWKVTKYKDVEEFFEWVFKSREALQFHTIVTDDLTELAELKLVEERPKHKDGRQAYYAMQDEVMALVRKFRNIPQQMGVMLAKQDRIKDGNTGGLVYSPMIPGASIAPQIPHLFGEIYQMGIWQDPNTGVKHRILRTEQDENATFVAGSRAGKLAPVEFADFNVVVQKLNS